MDIETGQKRPPEPAGQVSKMIRINEARAGNFVQDFDAIMEAPNITKDVIMRQFILRGLEEHIPRGRGVKKADLIENIRGLKRRGIWRDVVDENAVKRYKTANSEIPINQKPKSNAKDKGTTKKGDGQNNPDAAPEDEVPPRGGVKPRDERKANAKAERDERKANVKAEKEAKAKAKAEEAKAKAKAEKEAKAKAKAEEEARAKAKAEEEARAKAKAEEEARAKAKAEEEDKKRPLAPSKIHLQELRNVLIYMNNNGKITGSDAGVVSRLTDIKSYKRLGKEEQKETVKKMRDLYHKYVYHPYVINNPVRKKRG
jgi:hypothetical protein